MLVKHLKVIRYLGLLLSTLGASLLGNILLSKEAIRAGERTDRAGQDF